MAAFQTVGTKYKDCLREALVGTKMKMISEVKEMYKGKMFPPFIMAAYDGNVEDVRILLLEEGLDINQKCSGGNTALHYASIKGDTIVASLILRQKNLNINQQNNHWWTALHFASMEGHTEIVKLMLLKQTATQLNIKDNNGKTPLDYASDQEHTEIVNLLNEEKQKKDFQTIFDVYHSNKGCEESSFTRVLLSYLKNYEDPKTMAAFRTVGTKYKDCLREALVKMKMISNVKKKYKGKTYPPFIQAAHDGNVEDVRILLLEDGMDVNQKGKWVGFTALYWASAHEHIDVVNLLLQQKNLKINQQNSSGYTALHFASWNGRTEIVKILLNHSDIDMNIKSNAGKTPLKLAVDEGHSEIMDLLRAKEKQQEDIAVLCKKKECGVCNYNNEFTGSP